MYLNQFINSAISNISGAGLTNSSIQNIPTTGAELENTFQSRLDRELNSETSQNSSSNRTSTLDTNNGELKISLDDYFSNTKTTHQGKLNLDEIPLILPSMHNVSELADYTENKLRDLASTYGIPELPEQLHFNQDGQLVLPDEYPFAKELKAAFDENPGLLEAARTLTSVASHAFAIQERMAFNEQYATTTSDAERTLLLSRYEHLLDDSEVGQTIALVFKDNNTMLLTEV